MILSPLNSPFESDAPLCGQELLHANNLPFLLPTRTSVKLIVKTKIELSHSSLLLQTL